MEKKILAMITFPPHKAYMLIPLINDIECKVEFDGVDPANIKIEPFHPTSVLKGRSVPPKYRHPKTGMTWAGRGEKPKWLLAEVAKGKSIMEFLICKPRRPEALPPRNHPEYRVKILEILHKEPMTFGDLHKALDVAFGSLIMSIRELKEEGKIQKNLMGVWSTT
jgi:hypothetical protein